ncbi:MAG: hypothetical protein KDC76_13825 [Bacteroidetes bacterium]|nr:hypothetical protein [Bacteroidota bacterium]
MTWRDTTPRWMVRIFLWILILPLFRAFLPYDWFSRTDKLFELIYELRYGVHLYLLTRLRFTGLANRLQYLAVLVFIGAYLLNAFQYRVPELTSISYALFAVPFVIHGKWNQLILDQKLLLIFTLGMVFRPLLLSVIPVNLGYTIVIVTDLMAIIFLYRRLTRIEPQV